MTRVPTRLQDAPPDVSKLAESIADTLVSTIVCVLAEQYNQFDLSDPAWGDLTIGICEWATIKAAKAAGEA